LSSAESLRRRSPVGDRPSVAFTYDRYGHLFPEIDKLAAAKLDRVRANALVDPRV
jgi:hypothetical protein